MQKRLLEQAKRYYQKAWNESKGAKNPTGEGGSRYSLYSKPNFSKDEWSIVNRRKHSEFDNPKYDLDENRKWMYAKEKGSTVFAVYSKADVEDPTVLYGSRGEHAERDYARLNRFFEGVRDYAGDNRSTLNRLLKDVMRSKRGASNGVSSSGWRGASTGDVQFPLRESGGDGGRDFGDGAEDLRPESVTEYDKEASDDSGASSFITFGNDYATNRNFMKEGDTPNGESISITEDGHPVAKTAADETIFSSITRSTALQMRAKGSIISVADTVKRKLCF